MGAESQLFSCKSNSRSAVHSKISSGLMYPPKKLGSVILFLSLISQVSIVAQECLLSDCSAFVSTNSVCGVYGTATVNHAVLASCLCKQPLQFESYVESCYSCEQTFGNQTIINGFGLLNLCSTGVPVNATPSVTVTAIPTLPSISTPSTLGATPLVVSIIPTTTGVVRTSGASRTVNMFWVYLFICGVWLSGFRQLWSDAFF